MLMPLPSLMLILCIFIAAFWLLGHECSSSGNNVILIFFISFLPLSSVDFFLETIHMFSDNSHFSLSLVLQLPSNAM